VRLLEATRRFLGSHWFELAVAHGWPLVELFGIGPNDPVLGHRGLVTGLALTAVRGGAIISLEEGLARVGYPSGLVETYRCGRSAMDWSELWWECATIIGEP
jgi:hypothetical protein